MKDREFFSPEDNIRSTTQQISIYQVLDRIRSGEINIYPDFHRKVVWDKDQQSRLIESILLGIPLPLFYVKEVRWGEWALIDGSQRLHAIQQFVDGEFSLDWTSYFPELSGMSFLDIPEHFQFRILQNNLSFVVIDSRTQESMHMEVFHRINTSGVPLTSSEILLSTLSSEAQELLSEMASHEIFQSLVPSVDDTKIDHQTLIYYFFLIVLDYNLDDRTLFTASNIDNGFIKFSKIINDMSIDSKELCNDVFNESITHVYNYFGINAFYDPLNRQFRISLFVILTSGLMSIADTELENLPKLKIKNAFDKKLSSDSEFANTLLHWNPTRAHIEKQLNMFTDFLKGMM